MARRGIIWNDGLPKKSCRNAVHTKRQEKKRNYQAIKALLRTNPALKPCEVAELVDLHVCTVRRHMQKWRKWCAKEAVKKNKDSERHRILRLEPLAKIDPMEGFAEYNDWRVKPHNEGWAALPKITAPLRDAMKKRMQSVGGVAGLRLLMVKANWAFRGRDVDINVFLSGDSVVKLWLGYYDNNGTGRGVIDDPVAVLDEICHKANEAGSPQNKPQEGGKVGM